MISVLITSYNAQDYIAAAVKSILAQTEPELSASSSTMDPRTIRFVSSSNFATPEFA